METLEQYVPLDKSWGIRCGVLDLLHSYPDTAQILQGTGKMLSDDLVALLRAQDDWRASDVVDVGESGTLYRILQFAAWKQNRDVEFVRTGTLTDRPITVDASIVAWPQAKLLTLDEGTTQWASAAVLSGDRERLDKPPTKLGDTYDAVAHWKDRRVSESAWQPRTDGTIRKQAEAFVARLRGETDTFEPIHSEDFIFGVTLGYDELEAGYARWPSVSRHETNRVTEIQKTEQQFANHEPITSKDHRIVQAFAMKAALEDVRVEFVHPDSVNKSWPEFWRFLGAATLL